MDIILHVCPLILHVAVPVCILICVGNTILIKLPNINLFLIVYCIVYVVTALTCGFVANTDVAVIVPATDCIVNVLVYVAYGTPASTWYVVNVTITWRVDGGVVTVNPDTDVLVNPLIVICVEFDDAVNVPEYATVNDDGYCNYKYYIYIILLFDLMVLGMGLMG